MENIILSTKKLLFYLCLNLMIISNVKIIDPLLSLKQFERFLKNVLNQE